MALFRTGWITLILCLIVLPAYQSVQAGSGDEDAIKRCLKKWGKHPFKKKGIPEYRTIGATVKILGIGKGINDKKETKTPELVLVKPTVGVLTKHTMRLMNPNGWYCLKANVTVLGKSKIVVQCKAKVKLGDDSVTVIGSGDKGVTVLGKTVVERQGCKKK